MEDILDEIIGDTLARLPTVIRGGGYKKPCLGRVSRELTAKDILDLQDAHGRGIGQEKRSLSKVRHNHHIIAQLLAKNLEYSEVAEISGYSIERISTLACDPTMEELIEHYREAARDIAVDLGSRYRAIVGVASEELLERVEEQPEELTSMQLLDVVERLGDRCGMGPKSSLDAKVAVGVLVTDATLDAIKGAVDAAARGRVFQGQGRPQSNPGPTTSPGGRAGGDKNEGITLENEAPKERDSLPAQSSQVSRKETGPVAPDDLG